MTCSQMDLLWKPLQHYEHGQSEFYEVNNLQLMAPMAQTNETVTDATGDVQVSNVDIFERQLSNDLLSWRWRGRSD